MWRRPCCAAARRTHDERSTGGRECVFAKMGYGSLACVVVLSCCSIWSVACVALSSSPTQS
jgi:hypothetical protein